VKKFICITVLCTLCLYGTAAQETDGINVSDFQVPSHSPFMSSYFTQALAPSIFARFDYLDVNFEFHTLKAQYEGQRDLTAFQFNGLGGVNIQLTKPDAGALFKFAIPLYAVVSYINSETVGDSVAANELAMGSGLHIITDYVSLYGFVAYWWGEYFDNNKYYAAYKAELDAWEASGRGYEPVYPVVKDYTEHTHNVLWSVIPVINMKKLPLLDSVFSLFTGYLTMSSDTDGFKPSYQAQLWFRDINIGQCAVSLATVTGSDWYNSDAKYTAYGGRVGILVKSGAFKPSVVIEGGYRSFFDVVADNPSYYMNGPYGRLFLGATFKDSRKNSQWNWNYSLMVESSPQHWPLPKIGLFITLFGKPKLMTYFEFFDDNNARGFRLVGTERDLIGDSMRKR
jgi:hypothetical protein